MFAQGCIFKREKGDHRIYWKAGMQRPIILPRDTELPPGIILNNLRTLGVSREEYLEFLSKQR